MNVLQRELWHGQPAALGEMFVMAKDGRRARCALWSHWAGWELQLFAGDELLQTHVCRSEDEVFTTAEQWKQGLQGKGWL